MVSRLFVDVDDTLILWPKVEGSGALVSGQPKPNPRVISFVEKWKRIKGDRGEVIVWSLGGQKYAAEWAHKLLPHVKHAAWCKEPIAMQRGDLFIDDDPLGFYEHAAFHPDVLA